MQDRPSCLLPLSSGDSRAASRYAACCQILSACRQPLRTWGDRKSAHASCGNAALRTWLPRHHPCVLRSAAMCCDFTFGVAHCISTFGPARRRLCKACLNCSICSCRTDLLRCRCALPLVSGTRTSLPNADGRRDFEDFDPYLIIAGPRGLRSCYASTCALTFDFNLHLRVDSIAIARTAATKS